MKYENENCLLASQKTRGKSLSHTIVIYASVCMKMISHLQKCNTILFYESSDN